jgi:hypothetical protein
MALVSQAQIYVSTKGKDSNPGSVSQPVATLHRAQAIARTFNGKQPIHVIVKPGTYYLSGTIQFTSIDNKPNGIVFEAEKEGSVVISGGQKLNLKWLPYQSGIFVAIINEDVEIDQLFVNGARQRMARFPNTVEGKAVFDTWALDHHATYDSTLDPLLPERIRKWNNPQGAYVHAMHNYLWGDMHWQVNGKSNAQLDLTGGWQNNRPSKMHPVYRMVENIFEELDAPGEWYFDRAQRKLYYYPNVGVAIKKATVEVVTLRHLIELNGTKDHPVQNIHFKGFIFRHTARTFMDNKEPLQRSDWTVYRGGAIVFNGAENCTVSESEFDHVGGNTIFVNGYNKNITIKGCHIHHSGASGILFVGDSSSVRSPLYGYVKRDYAQLDTIRGPKNDAYPRDCLVEDCIITQTGRDEKQTAAVHISLAANIRINHCSIYDMPRAGINISEGNFGGHIIENSDIFNTVLETGDHGSFNSWGRDRYWTPDGKTVAGVIEKNPNWHWLDMLQPNIIRNNRWRCDFGWDIDLDDGSSHYRIYNNLLLANGLKLREGYDRIVTNNIILNNSLHPHVWFPQSGDVFKQNIVYSAYKPAVMSQVIPENGKWGLHLDSNLFVSDEHQMRRFIKNGCDSQSITGDPMFVDPVIGDFRVLPNSPALKMGFINFDTRHFGVQRPSLKAIAKTPVLPTLIKRPMEGSSSSVNVTWMGTSIRVPTGDEFSALGIGYADVGILIGEIPKASALEKAGFRSGDMIRSINTKSIRTIEEFTRLLSKKVLNTVEWSFELIRNQQRLFLKTVHQLNTFHNNTQK